MKKLILEEVEYRLNQLCEELRKLEVVKAETQGRFNALFRLKSDLQNLKQFQDKVEIA